MVAAPRLPRQTLTIGKAQPYTHAFERTIPRHGSPKHR